MSKLPAKPACLVIGRDHDLIESMNQRFGTKISIREANVDESLRMIYSATFSMVVILWQNKALELAHTISQINPDIDVILERSRVSLTPGNGQNGFIALLEKNQDRQELLDLIEHSIENFQPAVETPARKPAYPHLNLASMINRLPQIPLALDNRERLAHHLLDSVCAALRTQSGGLFLHDKDTASYSLVSRRNLGGFLHAMKIEDTASLVKSIASRELIIGENNRQADPIAGSFLCQTHCNLILPLIPGEDLLGWFLLKVPQQLAEENSELLLSMAFFSSECLLSEMTRSKTNEEIAVLRHTLSGLAEAVLLVREDKTMTHLSGEASLLEARGEIQDAHYNRLTSSKLKTAVQRAFDGDPHTFAWTHKNGSNRNYEGHAERIPGLGVLLYLRKRDFQAGHAARDGFSFVAAKTLLNNEITRHITHLQSHDAEKTDLSKSAVLQLLEAQSLLNHHNASSTVSIGWLVKHLKSRPGVRIAMNELLKERTGHAGISSTVAAGILVLFSRAGAGAKNLDVSLSLSGDDSSFAIEIHANQPDLSRVSIPDGLPGEFIFSILAELGIAVQTAAFGLRVNAAALKIAGHGGEVSPRIDYYRAVEEKSAPDADYPKLVAKPRTHPRIA